MQVSQIRHALPRRMVTSGGFVYEITVIGAGYVGLVTAVGLATLGHNVNLVETAPERLESLLRGRVPIHEAGLQDAFAGVAAQGQLTVAEVVAPEARLVMLCVGTPIDERGHADLASLRAALGSLEPQIMSGATVVIRSTMPLGTTTALIDELRLPAGRTFTNPEFLRQGSALSDFHAPSRVVIGRHAQPDPAAMEHLLEIARAFDAPVHVVSYADAEAIKNAANAFLALKLSYANEIAALCERYGADADAVLEAVGADPRIGPQFLKASYGFGGSCLPKELQTVAMAGLERGLEMHVTAAAAEANLAHQDRFAARANRLLQDVEGRRVAALGLAFKAGTDDTRSSPAVRVIRRLLEAGVEVVAYDPAASKKASTELAGVVLAASAAEALRDADLALILTEWPEFRDLDWESAVVTMRRQVVLDGRRLLDPARLLRLGVHYERIGSARPSEADYS